MKKVWLLLIVPLIILGVVWVLYRDINFTDEEIDWMNQHSVIYVAPDPTFGPVEFFDDNGDYQGVAADYIDYIEKRTPLKFETIRLNNWSEILEAIKNKEVDMLGAAVITEEREAYLLFSNPFYEIRNVILTRKDFKGKVTFDDLQNEAVIVLADYAIEDYLETNYPQIQRVPVNLVEEGIALLSLGTYDYMSASLAQISYYLDKNTTTNLKVSGDVDLDYNLRFAVRDDYILLPGIINKVLDRMPQRTKDEIYGKWINVGLISGVSKEIVYVLIAMLLIIFAVVLSVIFFNRVLKKRVEVKTAELNQELIERKRVEKALEVLNENLEHEVEKRTLELQNALNEMRALQGELVESEKMLGLSRITVNMAHNLNTPIGSAITMNSFGHELIKQLQEGRSDLSTLSDKLIEANDMIQKDLSSAREYIDQIKRVTVFSQAKAKQPINLKGYLILLKNTYGDIFAHQKTEMTILCDDDLELLLTTDALDCIFKTLIDNSLKHGFTPDHLGRIKIEIHRDQALTIIYQDNGVGISDEILSNVYEPLFTSNMGKTMGMGLYLMYNVVKFMLGGDLKIDNTKDEGVAFIITLPEA